MGLLPLKDAVRQRRLPDGRLPLLTLASTVVLWSLALLAPCSVRAQQATLNVTLDPPRHHISGTLTAAGLREATAVWWPGVKSAGCDAEVDSITYPWRFPGSPQFARVSAAYGDSSPLTPVSASCVPSLMGLDSPLQRAQRAPAESDSGGHKNSIRYDITIPQRFGPFGWVEGQTTLLGGWYPLPTLARPPCTMDSLLPSLTSVRVHITSTSAGLLIVGSRMGLVTAGGHIETEADLTRPLMLAFMPHYSAVSAGNVTPSTQETSPAFSSIVLGVTIAQSGSAQFDALQQTARRASQFLDANGGTGLNTDQLQGRNLGTFLLLQAPLREMMVLPFRGGLLVSDRLFRVARIGPLWRSHETALTWGLLCARMLEQGAGYRDALVLATLHQSLLMTNPAARGELSEWFRRGEVLSVIDQVGTDPQTGFQQGLFGLATLPDELAGPWASAVDQQSPWWVAHQILCALGHEVVAEELSQPRLMAGTMHRIRLLMDMKASGLGTHLFDPRRVDVRLHRVEEDRLVLHSSTGGAPLALSYRFGPQGKVGSGVCPEFPCVLLAKGVREGLDVLVDPLEQLAQRSLLPIDPRLDDRNYLDVKWMFSKAALSYSSQDSLPFAQVELALQPRYDLGNMAFVTPFIGPVRSGILAGYRLGLGAKSRANARLWSLAVGPRIALDSRFTDSWTAGLMASVLYSSYLSRTNPFDGAMLYAYALPFLHSPGGHPGLRTGGFATWLAGTTPDHILAMRLSLDSSLGALPEHEQAYSGGSEGVRALSARGMLRRHRVSLSLEYRLMVVRNLWESLLGLAWLEALQAVLFVDGAVLSNVMSGLFSANSTVLGAGIGLRPHVQLLGFVPATLAVDAAWLFPVGWTSRGGLSVLVGFTQAF